ncbi:MAG: HNH endonuclease [bacterium]|nr:HNH endonuclease [bacterium]
MSDELTLGQRLVACEQWRWTVGMKAVVAAWQPASLHKCGNDEKWHAVVGLTWGTDIYQVSDRGRMRTRRVRGQSSAFGPWQQLVGTRHRRGYTQHALRVCGEVQRISIHRAVLLAFVGKPPTPAHEVAHLDGDAANNRLDNLAWVTRKENSQHRIGHGTTLFGSRATGAQLSRDDAVALRALGRRGISCAAAARMFGVNKSTANRAMTGRTYRDPADVPDLADPATAGCLLTMLQDAGGDIRVDFDHSHGIDRRAGWSVHVGGRCCAEFRATRGEAVALALLNVWGAT